MEMHGSLGTRGPSGALESATDGPGTANLVLNAQRSYPAVPESVRLAREDVVALAVRAGAGPDAQDAIRLAVSEAATNVVKHAYPGERGMLHLTASLAGPELVVLIADDGCGLHTPAAEPGLGWGLAVISECGRDFAVSERADGGTEARIRFLLG
jgi:serine/threonine-protein kinase RsbW